MQAQGTIRLPGGDELVLSEWLHQPLYSTVEFSGTAAINLYAFNYVQGGRVSATAGITPRNATFNDTNVAKRKGMAQDESMVVFAATFETFVINPAVANALPQPAILPTDLKRIQRDTVVELRVGAGIKKPQLGIPFEFIGQSIGAESILTGSTNTAQYGTAGRIYSDNQRQLKLPTYIGGYGDTQTAGNSMKFDLRFFSPSGNIAGLEGPAFRIRFILDGLKKRPV
jgi:hypothetical protein